MFIHVLRLGLGNERVVSAFVTVCKFGKKDTLKVIKVAHKAGKCMCKPWAANFRVFVNVTSLFACGSC